MADKLDTALAMSDVFAETLPFEFSETSADVLRGTTAFPILGDFDEWFNGAFNEGF